MHEAGGTDHCFSFSTNRPRRGKTSPRAFVGKLPGKHDDWLICMISSQTHQYIAEFDEIVKESDNDFSESGLKVASVIRVGRLAIVSGEILLGAIGQISKERLVHIKSRLADWISKE